MSSKCGPFVDDENMIDYLKMKYETSEKTVDQDAKNIVYAHINKINGCAYIGISTKGEQRWSSTGNSYKGCTVFDRAIKKYGWDNFEHKILAKNVPKSDLQKREAFFIDLFDSEIPSNGGTGYNMKSYDETYTTRYPECSCRKESETKMKHHHEPSYIDPRIGTHPSKETRIKQSEAQRQRFRNEKPWNKGIRMSDESREKMSKAHMGVKLSKEHREAIGNGGKGLRLGEKHPLYGISPSNETRHKMSESHKKNWNSLRPEERIERISKRLAGKRKSFDE
jgi:group I intron endonuclease